MSSNDSLAPGATIRHLPGVGIQVELPSLRLKVLSGADKGRRYNLSLDLIRLGSADDNEVVLPGVQVSRHHAELYREGPRLVLRDLGSTNGSRVDGVQVKEAYLEPGRPFVLGDTQLEVVSKLDKRAGVLASEAGLGPMVGGAPAMKTLFGVLQAVAPTHATVMVLGESGTGKELVAQTVHELSGRAGPLVIFDAASTDPEMVRSDLFGHKKGSFTGAQADRDGAFRRAHGGTLFLDEIGELPLDLQTRLLRVLESRRVTPLGSDDAIPVDVRVVCATHRDLAAMVARGEFRSDLYHRLAVVPVEVPALRDRRGDLPLLVRRLGEHLGTSFDLSGEAEQALAAYPWPGNVRELRNALERGAALAGGQPIQPEHLRLPGPVSAAAGATSMASPAAGAASIEAVERQTIEATLARNGGNVAATARDLEMSLSTLHRRLKKYRSE